MRLLKLFSFSDSEYAKARKLVDHALQINKVFTLDANIIIRLAENNDQLRLQQLEKSPIFIVTQIIYNEIYGLTLNNCRKNIWKSNMCYLLNEFLNQIRPKIQKTAYGKIHSKLTELSVLLPRKIIHDAIFNIKNCLINEMIDKYEQFKEQMKDASAFQIGEIIKQAKEYRKKLDLDYIWEKYVVDLYLTRASELNVNERQLDETAYEYECKKFIAESLRKIDEATVETTGPTIDKVISGIIQKLQILAQKTYTSDIRFVSHCIDQAIEGYSLDSDVIWLYELHFLTSSLE